MSQSPVTLAVLAGGNSRRMGEDKAAIALGTRTMLDHTLAAAGALPTLVVGRTHPAATWIDDPRPEGRGPLAGLVAALAHTGGCVLLVGCDQPWLRPETVAALADLADPERPVTPEHRGVLQTLCSVYPSSMLERARHHLSQGAGPRALLDEAHRIPEEVWRGWGEDGRSWHSVDTPADLASGLRRYGQPG